MFLEKCSIQLIRDVSGITPSSVECFTVHARPMMHMLFETGNPKSRKPETGNRNPESETGIRNRNRKPETGNRNPESGIRNPESTNQRKQMQVLQVSENYLAKLLSAKK